MTSYKGYIFPQNTDPIFESSITGDYSNGDYNKIEADGTQISIGDATCWDDIRFPAITANLYVTAGFVDYNYDQGTVDFSTSSRYPQEGLLIVAQMPHARKADSNIYPHIHWHQTSNGFPNLCYTYRWFNNGDDIPAFSSPIALSASNNVYTYSGETALAQITSIPLPTSGVGKALSSFLCFKLFRDNANTSGLFAGVDTYTGDFMLKEYDIHIEVDMNGSRQEFVK